MIHGWAYLTDVLGAFPGDPVGRVYRCGGCGATVIVEGEPDPGWEDADGLGHDERMAAEVMAS